MKTILFLLFMLSFSCWGFDKSATVQADIATYDGNKIRLSGHVDVSSSSYALHSKTAILIRDEEKQTKFTFPWIELNEEVRAQFLSKYFLECDQVIFDYIKQNLLFFSRNRIYFYENQRKIYAEHADVSYEEKEGKIVLSKIVLTGNVEMHLLSEETEEKKEQYALADLVEYYPDKELLFLKSHPDKRVLFFDKTHELTISSQIVKAHIKEGKEVIEGMGDVRFTFKEDELNHLRKRFDFK